MKDQFHGCINRMENHVERLRDIALFVEVVKTRSFTKAAENLAMPASTLSRRISGLERAVGLRLLNRTTRRVEPSDAGAAYHARCAPLVEAARVAHEQLAQTLNEAQGTLRVACTPDFAMQYLAPVVTAFTRRHARVDVELSLSSQAADLMTDNLDVALRIGKLPDSTLVARPIATLQLALFASPHYLEVATRPQSPEDLAQHMCIRMRADEGGSTWHLQHARGDGPPRRMSVAVEGRFVVSSMLMIRQLTLLGAGIGVIDRVAAREDLAAGRLLPVLPQWKLEPVPLHMLTASRLMPARARLFGDFLAEFMASQVAPGA
jgi:DNA-binding transcriptional LysR family regulator